jgi:hypothetical protein
MTWLPEGYTPLLAGVLVLATLGTVVLLGLSITAYRRRGTRPYLIVSVVLALLTGRTLVGLGTVFGAVPMVPHHLIAHTIDLLTAALLLYTVYSVPLTKVEGAR